MSDLTLETAQKIAAAAIAFGREKKLMRLAVAVLDPRGALKSFSAEDGTSLKRGEVAIGKASAALAFGMGTRSINKMAKDRPYFINSVTAAVGGSFVPVPGGVLIKCPTATCSARSASRATSPTTTRPPPSPASRAPASPPIPARTDTSSGGGQSRRRTLPGQLPLSFFFLPFFFFLPPLTLPAIASLGSSAALTRASTVLLALIMLLTRTAILSPVVGDLRA